MRILLSLVLLTFSITTWAASCPQPKELVRTAGENSWFSNKAGWEGGFYYPFPGTGHSTHIEHFKEAQWIQINNRADSAGYVVCDYKGNYDEEIIRFTQDRQDAAQRPKHVNWTCKINTDYPSTACTCSGNASQCSF